MYMSTYLTNVVFEAVPHNFELIFGDDVVFEVVDGGKRFLWSSCPLVAA